MKTQREAFHQQGLGNNRLSPRALELTRPSGILTLVARLQVGEVSKVLLIKTSSLWYSAVAVLEDKWIHLQTSKLYH